MRFAYNPSDRLAILSLITNPWDLNEVWEGMTDAPIEDNPDLFSSLVKQVTGNAVTWCSHQGWSATCTTPIWENEAITPDDDEPVCESCLDRHFNFCEDCDSWSRYSGNYVDCRSVCSSCLDNYSYCDECEEHYSEGNEDDHRHGGCECEVSHPRFQFPANGGGTIANDEMLNVTLPVGTISPEGLKEIVDAIVNEIGYDYRIYTIVQDDLDPEWQKKDGNFTRRVSKAIFTGLGKKISPPLLSKIGNIARQHTSSTASHWIQFTRDLNASAEAFCNEGSCWWGSHSSSRCAFKQWGGIGLRSYDGENDDADDPIGRVWVQPLNADLQPTHDAVGAHAYVVYNSYEGLSGYAATRIVAHLTGRTYRKISLGLSPQYINGNSGYLVADEATCQNTSDLYFGTDEHDNMDARTINRVSTVAA